MVHYPSITTTPVVKPPYALDSVDNALRLIQLLRDLGRVRIKDAAAELGIAPSTAHRLMAMLVYRGFAIQDETRQYRPGPAIGLPPAGSSWAKEVRTLAQPHLEMLCNQLGETVSLVIRVGTKVRFLSTVESGEHLRVGDRSGVVHEACHSSGGKAMLATLSDAALSQLYRSRSAQASGDLLTPRGFENLRAELKKVSQQGYGINQDATEKGISAVGFALTRRPDEAPAAFAVASPSLRFSELLKPEALELMRMSQTDINKHLPTGTIEHSPSAPAY